MRYRNVALLAADLRSAEAYYAELFDLEVLFREVPVGPGGPDALEWRKVPDGVGWDAVESAGFTIGMVALARDEFILPLLGALPSGTAAYAIGLVMSSAEIDLVASRLGPEAIVESRGPGWLAFVDRLGNRWQLSDTLEFSPATETLELR